MGETLASPTATVIKHVPFGQLMQGTAGNFRKQPKFKNKLKIVRFFTIDTKVQAYKLTQKLTGILTVQNTQHIQPEQYKHAPIFTSPGE
jgi:hypothetical protein